MTTPRSNWLSQAITAEALKRFPQSIAGQAVFATGLVMMLAAGVGLPSWEILHQGLSKQLGIEIGTAAQLSGIFVLLLWIPLRQRPGLGTLSNIVIIGMVMNAEIGLLAYIGVPPAAEIATQPLLAGALAIAGTAIVGIGSGIYIGSGNGPGPRDGLMTGLHHRTGQRGGQHTVDPHGRGQHERGVLDGADHPAAQAAQRSSPAPSALAAR